MISRGVGAFSQREIAGCEQGLCQCLAGAAEAPGGRTATRTMRQRTRSAIAFAVGGT